MAGQPIVKKRLLFVLRQAPYGQSLAKEAIDAILATSAYDQHLSVVFIDDGVFQLVDQQQADMIEQKSLSKLLSAFALYDIQSLYACADSLTERGLSHDHLCTDIQVLETPAIQQLFAQQDHLLSF